MVSMAEKQQVKEYLIDNPPNQTQSRTICPVCSPGRTNHTERCMSVRIEEGVALFHCHHCGINGGSRIEDREEEQQTPARIAGLNEAQGSWFSSRGISSETIEKSPVQNGKVYIRKRGEEVDCVGFVYQNKDGSTATKWRDGGKNFSQTGTAKSLWGIEQWDGGDLVICEGEMDALSLRESGIFAVSVPNGAPATLSQNSDTKFSYLWDAKDEIEKADRIILATDNDEPGKNLSEEIARRVGKARCWRVDFPDGCKDPNDVLISHGKTELFSAISGATPWPVHGLRDVSEYRAEVIDLHDKGMDHGIKVGLRELDDIYRTCPQTLTVITGVPGSGKSSFLSWLSVQLAVMQGWPCAILSAETPPTVHLLQMAAIYKQQPYAGPNKMSEHDLSDALDWLGKRYVILDDHDTSIDSVLERAQAAVLRLGVRLLIVDPYNFLTGSVGGDGDENSVGNINRLLTKLKRFSVEHGIATWLVAHPTKMYRQNDGKVPVPTGYDVSGSAAFFNVCDAGLTVSRTEKHSMVTCWKARFPWIGTLGQVELSYDIDTGSFQGTIQEWGNVDDDEGWADFGD